MGWRAGFSESFFVSRYCDTRGTLSTGRHGFRKLIKSLMDHSGYHSTHPNSPTSSLVCSSFSGTYLMTWANALSYASGFFNFFFYALSGYGRIPKRSMNHPPPYDQPNAQKRVVTFFGGLLLSLSVPPAYVATDTWLMSTI